ncbi:MAG: AMP-binding protein [Defluviitaleaceae bacterium]|nr:AMP-binding protein [Defluviitaleaceae bacterium]
MSIALLDSKGGSLTYKELADFCDGFKGEYNLKERDFVFLLCGNDVSSAAFFIGCIHNRVVPLLLNANIDKDMLNRYISIYRPNYIFMDNKLCAESAESVNLYKQLSFLLPTSGSTGGAKLVRHSYNNIRANAANVARAFDIKKDERAMLTLPIYFTQGLSVLCSHLTAGASVYLSDDALSSREFWNSMKNEGITSFTGVPYSFEILDKLRFYTAKLPSLTVLSQGGGRLSAELWDKLATFAKDTGKRFYATYGASETTARMSMLPPESALESPCSIGRPIEPYKMWLIDEEGNEITETDKPGELVFQGENVTLGYAESLDDLAKGDERGGIYKTGDIAHRDKNGFYYISGRLARFIKIFGLRINLDETERLIKAEFGDGFACTGNDTRLYVCVADKNADGKAIKQFLQNKLKINISAFDVVFVEEIPRNQYGKVSYAKLKNIAERGEAHE